MPLENVSLKLKIFPKLARIECSSDGVIMNCFGGGTHAIDTLLSCDLTIYDLGDKVTTQPIHWT